MVPKDNNLRGGTPVHLFSSNPGFISQIRENLRSPENGLTTLANVGHFARRE